MSWKIDIIDFTIEKAKLKSSSEKERISLWEKYLQELLGDLTL